MNVEHICEILNQDHECLLPLNIFYSKYMNILEYIFTFKKKMLNFFLFNFSTYPKASILFRKKKLLYCFLLIM